MSMKHVASALLSILICVRLACAQGSPVAQSTSKPTLIMLAAGEPEHRNALTPALDALCETMGKDPGRFGEVVRVQFETDLSSLLERLSSKDTQKTDVVLDIQGSFTTQAFLSCRDGRGAAALPSPIEVLLFEVPEKVGLQKVVRASHLEVGTQVRTLGVYNALVNTAVDPISVGPCAAYYFWDRKAFTERNCFDFGKALKPEDEKPRAAAPVDVTPAVVSPSITYTRKPIWLIAAGAGAAISVAALIPWLIADAKVSRLERECPAASGCERVEQVRSATSTLDTLATVFLITGGLVAAGGISGYFVDTDQHTVASHVIVDVGRDRVFIGQRGHF
jgi:hypothetical protein